jgi:ketosteroid isomerase-like protein
LLGLESKQLTLHAERPSTLLAEVLPAPLVTESAGLMNKLSRVLKGNVTTTTTPTAVINEAETALIVPSPLRVVGEAPDSPAVTELLSLMRQVLSASNAHDSDRLLSFYAREYISGDKLKRPDIKNLVEDTWKQYPDIRYTSDVLELRINGHWATLETRDKAIATAKNEAQLPGLSGQLCTDSRSLVFLRKVGERWLIASDNVLYETALITYGEAVGMPLMLAAPDQVFAGEGYSAKLDVTLPVRTFAIAGINQEPLVFPHQPAEDKFRTISAEKSNLERVFSANRSNHNELITATLGLTQVGRDEQQRPVVSLKGIATVVKRVNVLPLPNDATGATPTQTSALPGAASARAVAESLVRESADGRIQLTPEEALPSSDDDAVL